jgi:anion-transporting  ArsA/GET3 family ATPase
MQSALGVSELNEWGVTLIKEGTGELRASLLQVSESFRRWILDAGLSAESRTKLFNNGLFAAISDKIATSTDAFAAVRMAEWLERWPEIEDLVIDTAPGLHAIDFLTKPSKMTDFLDSKLVDWLKGFVIESQEKTSIWQKVVKAGARKVLDGLSQVGGQGFLLNFGEFLILLDGVIVTLIARLERAKLWLKSPDTQYYMVTAVRDDSLRVTKEFCKGLKTLGVQRQCVVLNRTLPEDFTLDPGTQKFLMETNGSQSQVAFRNHLKAYSTLQKTLKVQFLNQSLPVVVLPVATHLDAKSSVRQEDLAQLGAQLEGALF